MARMPTFDECFHVREAEEHEGRCMAGASEAAKGRPEECDKPIFAFQAGSQDFRLCRRHMRDLKNRMAERLGLTVAAEAHKKRVDAERVFHIE